MNIADRVARLKPSATLSVSARAQELKAQGKDILSLSVGEPDFPTPEHICAAAREAIDAGFTRYTPVPGLPELRAAAAGYFARFYSVRAAAENILISSGAKHSLYTLFQSLLNPGDHVLIPAPYWVSYPPMVELAGAKPVTIPTSPENAFKLSLQDLNKSLTPKTRLLVLNSPSNPTGVCYTQPELDAIAAWGVANNLLIVSDEIYDRLVYTPEGPASLAPWWEAHPENFVIVNGVAKTFSMTGWRIGYTLAEAGLIAAMGRLQGQSTSNASSVSQKAALAALAGEYSHLDLMCRSFRERRDLALAIIASWPDVLCPRPDGAFYLFPDLHRHYREAFPDSTALCAALLESAGVALVPGAAFGDDHCVRISYAVDAGTLEKALARIARFLGLPGR
ncbi:MAG: pyridoxal phosphate-dependent aminotransferase [Desulfovibrio sp.]|jgi:aspartate aminotransferase|nr:pyridoxal phosphate-dependent aminotransferase [Desulfovibrio sp.]